MLGVSAVLTVVYGGVYGPGYGTRVGILGGYTGWVIPGYTQPA